MVNVLIFGGIYALNRIPSENLRLFSIKSQDMFGESGEQLVLFSPVLLLVYVSPEFFSFVVVVIVVFFLLSKPILLAINEIPNTQYPKILERPKVPFD